MSRRGQGARNAIRALVCLLPMSGVKRRLLRLVGYHIAADAALAPALVWAVDDLDLGAGSDVGFGNTFRGLARVSLGPGALMGQWNWVSASRAFPPADSPREFVLGREAAITSRHYVDATGGLRLGDFSVCAGARSTFLTHGAHYRTAEMTAAPIEIGAYCLINSNCTVLAGTVVDDRVVVGASALVTGHLEADGLYLGDKARRVRDVDGAWFERSVGFIDPKRGANGVRSNPPA